MWPGLAVFIVAAGRQVAASEVNFLQPVENYPECTCNCCIAAENSLTSESFPVCVPPPQSSYQQCVKLCKSRDSIISNARRNDFGERLLNYERFCKWECKAKSCNPKE